jgi:nucleoside-diphosphate-sugar epimerase
MRVLIVGCGYVGLSVGAELARQGEQVFGIRRSAADRELKAAGITPLRADITKADQLGQLPCDYDWIVNCVSSSGGGPEEYRSVYLEGTRNLIARLADARPTKFVYTSSTSVYGQTDGSLVDENSVTEPATATGQILVETEQVLRSAARQNGFPAVILRLAGIYGPDRGYWFKQFLSGQARIEGTGERLINMIHRDDVTGAVVAALRSGVPGETYNAVDNEPVTQVELMQWLSAELGRPMPPVVHEPNTSERKRALTHKRVSNEKLTRQLGYRFKYPTFREGYSAEIARMDLNH